MRVKLPESVPDRKRSFGGTAVSTLVHALVIGGTVVATGFSADRALEPAPPDRLIYIPAEPPRRPPAPVAPRPAPISTHVDPPPVPVENIPDLRQVPTGISAPTTVIGNISQDDFRSAPRDTVPAGTGAEPSGEAFTELMVERAVRPREGNPAPRYPSMLASAGVEGVVYAQFVVDTTGRVEPESIHMLKSDHLLFERAVREVLLRSRFVPAELGSRHVRQLVEQAFSFTMKR